MTDVIVVCEGQTEEAFMNGVLYPVLSTRNVFVEPRLIATSRHAKGGALNPQRVLRYLRNTLRERRDAYVTTFFDLYGLPSDFPGQPEKVAQTDPLDFATLVETGFHEEVVQQAGCRPERFFPHIQPYEFESLLFSDTRAFGVVESVWQKFVGELAGVRKSARSPEHVNCGPDTHPSARLERLLRPRYRKVAHGVAVSVRVGLSRMRAECRHFDQWVERVEGLSPLPQLSS